jgi:hypothetical protein
LQGDDVLHPDEPLLTIAIPLPPVGDAAEWGHVGRMLSATLRSIYAQTDAAFRIVICGERMPPIDVVPDFRLEYLAAGSIDVRDCNTANEDKIRKLGTIALRSVRRGGGYFMPLDMDDFISVATVAFIRANPDPNGYLVDQGYALDAATNMIAPLPDQRYHKGPFHLICGSSAIVRLTPGDLIRRAGGATSRFQRLFAAGHMSVAREATAEGRPLRPLPFQAAVYVLNHGLNLSLRREAEDPDFGRRRRRMITAINQNGVASTEVADQFHLPARYPVLDPPAPTAHEPAR